MTELVVDDVCFKYKDKDVLKNISFKLENGEILGILGPNGCGKTTLLRNMNGNLLPDSGTVFLDGADIRSYSKKEIAKKISSVPQTNDIRFAFTVEDIVSMGRMPYLDLFSPENREDENIVHESMRMAGIFDFKDRYVNTMSGGERQKVIIARSLAQTTDLVLMDEPTLHLDVSAQFEILDIMSGLSQTRGLTIVVVSHDLSMVAKYCDRILLIHDHRIHALGTPEDVLTPENMATVFNVDAELGIDSKTGRRTVILHGSAKKR